MQCHHRRYAKFWNGMQMIEISVILRCYFFPPLLSGTPGRLLSAEPAGLTWVGSSQPPRRTCLHLVSGVSPVQLCSPVSRRVRGRKGDRALVSSACDAGPPCHVVKTKTLQFSQAWIFRHSLAAITSSDQCITQHLSPLAANPSY